ncbi:MAG: HAD-IA family hydrolase [Elusimicrobiaceae bacterium]|nr:HAD-IA family hydrolase [Elusimicrobiaceae bacterium]
MLVIFDLDGTLLNTIDDLTAAANQALWAYGFAPRSVEECRSFVGNGVSKLLECALPENARTPENLERMRGEFFAYYDAHLWDKTRPYGNIGAILTALQGRNIKLAVASNKYQRATKQLVEHFFPRVSFAAVLGQRENVPTKPDPQIVQEILSLANEIREHTLYVGDSGVDMQTAQNAGVKACGVTWGFRSRAELAAYHPAHLIDSPYQLLDLTMQ